MQSIDNVLKLRKGLKPDDPNPDIFDVLWAKKLSSAGVVTTLTGNPLSFLVKKAQKALTTKISFEPIQEGTGTPSPDNIRPIVGKTSVSLNGCGKNQLNNDDIELYNVSDTGNRYGVKYTISGTYVLKAFIEPTTNQYVYAKVKHSDDTWGDTISIVQARNIYTRTITLNDGDTMYVYNASSGSSAEATATRFDARQVMVTYGTEIPTTYEPYAESNDITITFPNSQNTWSGEIYASDVLVNTSGEIVENLNYDVYKIDNLDEDCDYTLSHYSYYQGTSSSLVMRVAFFDNNDNFIIEDYRTYGQINTRITFTAHAPEGTSYALISVRKTAYNVQFEKGQEATTYVEYGNTTYGGEIDVESGILTLTWIMLTGGANWTATSQDNLFVYNFGSNPPYYLAAPRPLCNKYEVVSSASSTSSAYNKGNNTFCVRYSSSSELRDRFYIRDDRYNSTPTFREANTDLQVVYNIIPDLRPTISLTSEEVQLLKGVNNIWTDGDSIELTYKA